MNLMRLLCEDVNSDVELLTESTKSGKVLYIEGIFAQAETLNGNRRIYPESVLMPEVERLVRESVSRGTCTGELEHPDYPLPNLKYASHKIESLKIEGKNVIGKARILDGIYGQQARALLEGGVKLGVSTRGLASLRENSDGVSIVGDDYRLFTADIVGNPSAPDAYVNGVLEGKQFAFESGMLVVKEDVRSMTKKRLDFIREALKILQR